VYSVRYEEKEEGEIRMIQGEGGAIDMIQGEGGGNTYDTRRRREQYV